jgi:hypothetical protein
VGIPALFTAVTTTSKLPTLLFGWSASIPQFLIGFVAAFFAPAGVPQKGSDTAIKSENTKHSLY